MCAKATKNFNYVMAGASTKTIIAPEKLVEIGEIDRIICGSRRSG